MNRTPQTPSVPIFEPPQTRKTQMFMCASFVACVIVARTPTSSSHVTLGDWLVGPLTLATIIHHLVVLIQAFRQRRRKYRPRDIERLVPTTAKMGVVLSCWVLTSLWIIGTLFYMMERARSRSSRFGGHRSHHHPGHPRTMPGKKANASWMWIVTMIEALLLAAISVMCSRERLDTIDRLEARPQRIRFVTGEDGEYMVVEEP